MEIGEKNLNKTHLGDCIYLAKKLPENSIDLIVTSPPYADTVSYGKEVEIISPDNYVNWFLPLFHEAFRFLKPTGSFILNINDRASNGERHIYVYELVTRVVKETGLKLFDRYIWFKKSALPMPGEKRLNDRIEYIFHFVKDTKKFKTNTDAVREPYEKVSLNRFKSKVHGNDIIKNDGTTELSQRGSSKPHPLGKKPITVFRFDTGSALRGLKHPAPFHPQLPGWFIKWLTDEGDIVLDPFMGGGTTAEAALKLKRKYIGFEINPEYIKMTQERLKKAFPNKTINEFL
ncbi:MAG TPA: site-specific DNA-methyltransferase [Caldisericia bacterium]|jgi:DNA modification methylase|nr:site-specific DNA-methyltransferase [Caldisericia bacterium]